MSAALV
jgi:hypothetical protein